MLFPLEIPHEGKVFVLWEIPPEWKELVFLEFPLKGKMYIPWNFHQKGPCLFPSPATVRELGKMSVPWALRQERTNEVEGEMSLCCLAVRWMVGILGTTGGTDGSYSQVWLRTAFLTLYQSGSISWAEDFSLSFS
jgi:hypothetical protein